MTTTAKGGKPYRCSFCGKSQDQVRKLIAGQGVYICDECITLCREIVDEEFMEAPKARTLGQKIPSPRRINEILDQYVIGQDQAKKTLSVAVYNHYKRVSAGHRVDDVELGTTNILFICGGAFDGLEKIVEARVGKKTMGFGATLRDNTKETSAVLQQVMPDDLLKYGLIPEFVGRLPVVVPLMALDETDLFRI